MCLHVFHNRINLTLPFCNERKKIYKTLKTHVKTHPVALLLSFFFFFIVSKPPWLILPSWVPKVPSRFMLPAKNPMLFFVYETLKGSEELVWKCSYATDGIGIWKCWFFEERRRRQKPLWVTAKIKNNQAMWLKNKKICLSHWPVGP